MQTRRPVTSVYFGGGTPALLLDHLPRIRAAVDEAFDVGGPCGIELHPEDGRAETVARLREAGFDMASLGMQSFQPRCLERLGRRPADLSDRIGMVRDAGFGVVDVDLIFGLPDQTEAGIQSDFRTAVQCGATQISTYPFISFSWTRNSHRPPGRAAKRALLEAVLEVSGQLGFERTSVWTFARKGTGRYSSVTRDSYLGFGPGAASLLGSSFSVNVFSVTEYAKALENGASATALTARLSPRERALFWLFWNAYNLRIDRMTYRDLFGNPIEEAFGAELRLARRAGIVVREDDSYRLTRRGAYLFHLVEQQYTDQYIDKVWRLSQESAWPRKLVMR